MCDEPGCDSDDTAPQGEKWCPRRLDIELRRWFTNYPGMKEKKPLRNISEDLRSNGIT